MCPEGKPLPPELTYFTPKYIIPHINIILFRRTRINKLRRAKNKNKIIVYTKYIVRLVTCFKDST